MVMAACLPISPFLCVPKCIRVGVRTSSMHGWAKGRGWCPLGREGANELSTETITVSVADSPGPLCIHMGSSGHPPHPICTHTVYAGWRGHINAKHSGVVALFLHTGASQASCLCTPAHLLSSRADEVAICQVAVQQAARVGGQELHSKVDALHVTRVRIMCKVVSLVDQGIRLVAANMQPCFDVAAPALAASSEL